MNSLFVGPSLVTQKQKDLVVAVANTVTRLYWEAQADLESKSSNPLSTIPISGLCEDIERIDCLKKKIQTVQKEMLLNSRSSDTPQLIDGLGQEIQNFLAGMSQSSSESKSMLMELSETLCPSGRKAA